MKEVDLFDLGRAPYRETWDLQAAIQQRLIEAKRKARKEGHEEEADSTDVLLFVEHPHVYTLGKSGDKANLLRSDEELERIDATFVPIDRGGDITYHGPGQLVGYPIFDLDRHFTDIGRYLRSLEEVIIRSCADYGIEAGRIKGLTGVWVDDAKVCAMGIKCSRWVTMHGFAFNVNTQLDYFGHIVPCGIDDKEVTSLKKLLGYEVDMDEVKERVIGHFEEVFGIRIVKDRKLPELEGRFSYFQRFKESQADPS